MRKILAATLILLTSVAAQAQTTIKGSVTLTANAVDSAPPLAVPCGVASVQFYIGAVALGPQLTTPPYVYIWDTTKYANAAYSISAKATDKAGLNGACDSTKPNVGTSTTQSVTVNNPVSDTTAPTVTFTIAQTVAGIVSNHFAPIQVTASDDSGISLMELFLNDTRVASWSGATRGSYTWNTRPYRGSSVTIRADATDGAGNKGSQSSTVTVK